MMYLRMYVSVTLRNVAVTSRRNVANQRSYVILLRGRKVGPGKSMPQAVDIGARARERRRWMEWGLQPWWWRVTV